MRQPALTRAAALDVLIFIALLSTQSAAHAQSSSPHYADVSNLSAIECAVNPINVSDTGYQLDVYLANTGSKPIKGWKVVLDFNEPTQVTGSWNANMSEASESTVIASNVRWNDQLLPGQMTSFGIQGVHDGTFDLPTCSAQ